MSKRRKRKVKTTIQEVSGIDKKQRRRRKKDKITAEKVGKKVGKAVGILKKVDIALQEWAEGPVVPVEKIKKSKGRVGRFYGAYKRAQKAETAYAGRLEKGAKAHQERLKQMDSLVGLLGK